MINESVLHVLEEMGLIQETYKNELNPLIKYINAGIDPYDFMHLFTDWLEFTDQDPADWGIEGDDDWDRRDHVIGDPEAIIGQMSVQQREQFLRFLKHHATEYDVDSTMPIYMHVWGAELVKRPTWLTHFSDDADEVASSGFKYGTDDPWRAGLTRHLSDEERKSTEGWNFAFEANSPDAARAARNRKYGNSFVLFQSAGIKFHHDGDLERQVMFYGPGVREFIYVNGADGEYMIDDIKTGRMLFHGAYDEITTWAIENVRQYANRIVSRV